MNFKMNVVEPYADLHDVLQRMVDGHPIDRLDELLLVELEGAGGYQDLRAHAIYPRLRSVILRDA